MDDSVLAEYFYFPYYKIAVCSGSSSSIEGGGKVEGNQNEFELDWMDCMDWLDGLVCVGALLAWGHKGEPSREILKFIINTFVSQI